MATTTLVQKTGLLINNAEPLPDATVLDYNVQTVAAAGTTQVTATALVAPINIISNNTAANGVILPVGTIGQRVIVYPALVTDAPKVYPPVGGSINSGTTNASIAHVARTGIEYVAIDTTGLNWITIGL